MEEVLRALLKDHADVAALTQRVDWGVLPQAKALPAIALHLIDAPRTHHLRGRTKLVRGRVQVDCWATSFGGARELARAAIAAMDTSPVPAPLRALLILDERADAEPSEGKAALLYRRSLDVRAWFFEA